MERFNPLNDYLFLKLMGEEGDEEQCLAFLNAVLLSKSKQPVKLVRILENKTFVAEVIGDKTSILDVRVETDTGEKVNIEVQLLSEFLDKTCNPIRSIIRANFIKSIGIAV